MNKRAIIAIGTLMCCLSMVFGGNESMAKQKTFEKKEIIMTPSDTMHCMYENEGKVQYAVDEYNGIVVNTIKDDSAEKEYKASRENHNIIFENVVVSDNTAISVDIKQKKYIKIEEYNKKGKKIFSFKDKPQTKKKSQWSVKEVWKQNNKIYYVVSESNTANLKKETLHIRCLDKKNKKIISDNAFKVERHSNIKHEDGKIYVLTDKNVDMYSNTGKKLNSYRLPEGERNYDNVGDVQRNYLEFHEYDVCGKYIYYCNANGIFRCDAKKSNNFELYYDAKDDEFFGKEYGVVDMCFADNNTFYIMLNHCNDFEACMYVTASKIIEYSK